MIFTYANKLVGADNHIIKEPLLGYNFGSQYSVRKDVEYCQWNEIANNNGDIEYKEKWSKE